MIQCCLILLRPHQHITGFRPKSPTKDTHDQYIIGVTLSFTTSFQVCWVKAVIPLSLTLGVNNTGKAGNNSVEFCHRCTYQETEGGASVTPARNCYLDLDLPRRSWRVCSLMDKSEYPSLSSVHRYGLLRSFWEEQSRVFGTPGALFQSTSEPPG